MKLVKLPSEKQGEWWILIHDLSLEEGLLRKLRPINVLTHLAKTLMKEVSSLPYKCFALENKLFGARFYHFELRKALAKINDPIYRGKFVREYEDQQEFICVLEAYLNSIYSALEISSQINRILHPDLPLGFRDQSKKFSLFSLENKAWLKLFYDLRIALTHFESSLPQISEIKILITITHQRGYYLLQKGHNEIPINEILNFSTSLFTLLDEWAISELKNVDPEIEIGTIRETGLNSPLKMDKIKAHAILDLLEDT